MERPTAEGADRECAIITNVKVLKCIGIYENYLSLTKNKLDEKIHFAFSLKTSVVTSGTFTSAKMVAVKTRTRALQKKLKVDEKGKNHMKFTFIDGKEVFLVFKRK